ncbi:MAG: 1-deoxy-D-xylulose-5-phosphate reductoisomerase, partial [Acidimicrobiales bacterium]
TLAQLSVPDMCLPIGYALGYPERLDSAFGAVDWGSPFELTFEAPDREVFGCLDLAYRAGRAGGGAPAWLNAANEVAVAAFLSGDIGWLSIIEVVEETLDAFDDAPLDSLEAVLDADHRARVRASSIVERLRAAR